MSDLIPVSLTALIVVGLVLSQVVRRSFDPFAPIWLFLVGFFQIYVIQAISYRQYGLIARGLEILLTGNIRALWALILFLAVYHCGVARKLAACLPQAPRGWSMGIVTLTSPLMIAWGLICSVMSLRVGSLAEEDNIFVQFPMLLLIGGVMLLVTGRQEQNPRPMLTTLGILVCAAYGVIWMFNSKRSHSLFAVLAGVCAFYLPRFRRPSMPIMAITGFLCVLVVSVAIGWRGTSKYEQNVGGFVQYLSDFRLDTILINLNLKERDADAETTADMLNKETEEIGGYWLMLDTVPEKSPYDYGSSYLRIVSTFIPRKYLWPNKPYYGRAEWIAAWQAGSKQSREDNFTGPAIGLLGATQLNGGALATAIVVAVLALLIRTGYDYYRLYADRPWAQVWWSMTYFNAWLMNANDDPFVWFYYVYGFTTFPVIIALWIGNTVVGPGQDASA